MAAKLITPSPPDQHLRTAVGAAVVLHIILLVLLSVQWTRGERRFDNPPMEVDLIADTGPVSTAPEISETPPAAKLGEEEALSREALTAPPEQATKAAAPKPTAPVKPTPQRSLRVTLRKREPKNYSMTQKRVVKKVTEPTPQQPINKRARSESDPNPEKPSKKPKWADEPIWKQVRSRSFAKGI